MHNHSEGNSSSDPKTSSASLKGASALLAGSAEHILFQPLDSVRTRIQNHQGRIFSTDLRTSFIRFGEIAMTGGSLYSGFIAGCVDMVIKRGYKFVGQNLIKDKLGVYFSAPVGTYFSHQYKNTILEGVAGCLIGLGEVFFLPVNYWKTNKQNAASSFQNRSIAKVLFSKEGYAGWEPTIVRNFFGSTLLFGVASACYPFLFNKEDSRQATLKEKFIANLMGSIASVLGTMPADVVKIRMQIAKSQGSEKKVFDVMREIWQKEGSLAFFKGGAIKTSAAVLQLAFALTFYKWLEQNLNEIMSKRIAPRIRQ